MQNSKAGADKTARDGTAAKILHSSLKK